jgi:DNA-binding winged helix-turn-helix (wHTH) protein
MRALFERSSVDFGTREVFRDGEPVHLSPKGFLVLELLFENRPRALSKAAIHEKIWPESFVSESTLASLIAEIRVALGDAGEPHLLRTIHGFGYAFSGAAAMEPDSPAARAEQWRVIREDRAFTLSPGENLLGRDHASPVTFDLESVSRRHARILITSAGASLEDLGSKNGTFLRGKRIDRVEALEDGDEIRIGSASLRIQRSPADHSTKTEIEPER